MPKTGIAIAALFVLLFLSACGVQEGKEDRTHTEEAAQKTTATQAEAGPAIGTAAPIDMALVNAGGESRKIADIAGENGTVLVFFRSADWCGFCKAQLKELQGIADDVAAQGYTLSAISYDTPEIQKEFAQQEGLTFTVLSDKGSKMIDAFGIRDPAGHETKYDGYPYASIFVLDTDGTVKARTVSTDYKVRPTNAQITAMLDSGE